MFEYEKAVAQSMEDQEAMNEWISKRVVTSLAEAQDWFLSHGTGILRYCISRCLKPKSDGYECSFNLTLKESVTRHLKSLNGGREYGYNLNPKEM